jgi:cytochrome c-type biogenesis protein
LLGRIPIAFLAGFVSFLAPCVLPLVPGYLSTVSAVEAGRLGERGSGRRVVVASLPFFAGFTAIFVLLGAGASALGNVLPPLALQEISGFILVVFGLVFLGVLPWPERLIAPGLLSGAQSRGSRVLLGVAFGVCAAPCIGPVLGAILVLAGGKDVLRGSILLAAYSLGLAVPFVLAALMFVRAMGVFRQIRDHYRAIQMVSGALLVALGLLLFFDRFWWLRIGMNRALQTVGLGT